MLVRASSKGLPSGRLGFHSSTILAEYLAVFSLAIRWQQSAVWVSETGLVADP